MEDLTSRAYCGAPDLKLLIEFARRAAAARWPRSTYKNVGDMVWEVYNAEFENCRLWFDGTELVAYASFGPPFQRGVRYRARLAALRFGRG